MKTKKENKFVCTDSDTKQYGRKINNNLFEFYEKNIKHTREIHLKEYTEKEIESIINSYGYSLYGKDNIKTIYGKKTNWVIAECIYETEILE